MNNLLRGAAIISLVLAFGTTNANAVDLFNKPTNSSSIQGINGPVTSPTSPRTDSTVFIPPSGSSSITGGNSTSTFSGKESSATSANVGNSSDAIKALTSRREPTVNEQIAMDDNLCSRDIWEDLVDKQAIAMAQDINRNSERVTLRTATPSHGALACTPLFQARIANAAIDLVQSNGFALKFFRVQALDLSNLGSKLPIGGALVGAIGAELSFMVNGLINDIGAEITSGLFGKSGINFSADDCNAMQELAAVSNCALLTSPVSGMMGYSGSGRDICSQTFPNTTTLIQLLR